MSDSAQAARQFGRKHRELLAILSDGKCHFFGELMKRLNYDADEQQTLFVQVSSLRKILQQDFGQTIVCESDGSGPRGYRHVVLITPDTSPLAGLKNS